MRKKKPVREPQPYRAGGPELIERATLRGLCLVQCPECGESYEQKATAGVPVNCRKCGTPLYPKVGADWVFRANRRA